MWTEITRRKYEREGQRYASDVTDAEWALIEPHMPTVKRLGRPRETELRAVLDAILYIARTGCQWRMLPKDFPRLPPCKVISTIGETTACLRRSILRCCWKHAKQRAVNRAPRPGSSTVNRSRRPRAVGRGGTMRPRRSKAASAVCHEHITRVRRCGAMQEMRVGPSRPAVRCRPQTAASCSRQERLW